MRRPLLTRYDTVLLGTSAALVTAILVTQHADLRLASMVLGVAVFALLMWRLVSTWDQTTVLEHALAILLALSPLVAAVVQAALVHEAGGSLPDNPWIWLWIAHRCGCVVLVVFWTRWLGRRHSPFRRGDDTRRGSVA